MSLVTVRGLSKRYGSVTALNGLSLSIEPGTRTAVIGPSGSGKTTLLRLIAGFERPDSGQILLDDKIIADARSGVPPHQRNIGLVMQDGALFPHLTVVKNIAFGFNRATPEPKSRALELMDTVELDRSMAERRPHELSGGQQQRVALARALARRPRLMLLDEPFSALDSGLREQMRKATAAILSGAGITTVLVTHDQTEAMSFADQIVVLRAGRLRQAGAPRDVYLAPVDRETAEFLGQAIILDAVVADGIAVCSLGNLAVPPGRAGKATIMLRPEQIALRPHAEPAVNGHDVPIGRVVAADFAGPVASVTIELAGKGGAKLAGAQTLAVKAPAMTLPRLGALVEIIVIGPAHVVHQP